MRLARSAACIAASAFLSIQLTVSAGDIPCKAAVAPTPFALHDNTVLGYELLLGNGVDEVPTPAKVIVRSENASGQVLLELSGPSLSECVKAPYNANPFFSILLWVVLPQGVNLPANLWNEVQFESVGAVSCSSAVSLPKGAIAPPVCGGNWVANNGSSNLDHHHRWFFIQMNQVEYMPQRFAVDWIKLDKDGKPYKNDGKKNRDWYSYGEPLVAVADGVVMDMKDGMPDNIPFQSTIVPITSSNVLGNFVLLKLDDGRHVAYAHIIPGTVRVKTLQKVKKGQILGKLGNSGNTTGPHLHFHVCEGPDALFSQGLPYVHDGYDYVGYVSDDVYHPQPKAHVMDQMPGRGDVVVFPNNQRSGF